MFYSVKINYKKCVGIALACILLTIICIKYFTVTPCTDCEASITNVADNTSIDERSVYLTFDDGPSPTTQAVLDVLATYNVPATFFVISDENTKPYMNLVTRAYEEGHLIALHSATHDYKKIYKSPEAFWADIEELKTELKKHVPQTQTCLRFPGGSTNTVSAKYGPANIMETLKTQALEKGYTYYDWNICVNDAVGKKKSSGEIADAAIKAGKKNNCIVLFHDSKQNSASAQALPEIIKWYKDAGFVFKTVDKLKQ